MKIILTPKQAEVLTLYRHKGWTQKRIAQELGCTSTNVNQILMRIASKYPELRLPVYAKRKVYWDTDRKENEIQ